ncbi:MAG TPA: beta-propeller fold lactonase family protein [Streptosporangiaceae bacterium]
MLVTTVVRRVALGCAVVLAAAALYGAALYGTTLDGAAAPAPVTAAPPGVQRTLYTTNGGSADISAFTIGPGGELTRLGPAVPAGELPRAIVLTPDGRRAYVVSNAAAGGGLLGAYAVDARGALSRLGPPLLIGRAPFGLAVSPDGRRLYATEHDAGTVAVFTITPDGAPARVDAPVTPGPADPNAVAVSPDGRFLYVSGGRPQPGQPGQLATFAIGVDGSLSPLGEPLSLESAGAGLTFTPNGRFLYLTTTATGGVHAFRVGRDGGLTPVAGSPYPAPARPVGSAVTPDGRHLFVGVGEFGTTPNGVWGFRIGRNGALTPLAAQPFPSGIAPIWVTATPDGRHLYAVNRNTSDVSGFAIGPGGALTEVVGSPVPTGGQDALLQSIAVRPDQGPIARFGARAAPAGRPSKFDAAASTDPDGRVARYDWDFGDGTRLVNGGAAPRHVYRSSGDYMVTMTVTDNEGCSTSLVYTGQSALCHGTRAAATSRTVSVR